MGGIIVVDFIDMHQAENRHKVYERMKMQWPLTALSTTFCH